MTNERLIVLGGSTGALGKMIARHLVRRGGRVRALVRPSSDPADVGGLRDVGAEIAEVDTGDVEAVAGACAGAHCLVSAVAGQREVVVGAQTVFVDGAVKAGVPRFIPSDFAIDFYKVPDGENRNLDLRREFARILDERPIAATSVLNGVFSEFLFMPTPYYVPAIHRSVYFGEPDQAIDLTAMDDTADYTAAAALDDDTPRFLRIAGNVLTPEGLAAEASAATGEEFKAVPGGNLALLSGMIKAARFFDVDETDSLYPPWQGMQYVHNMQSGQAKLDPLDNDRYPDVTWTPLRETLAAGKPAFFDKG